MKTKGEARVSGIVRAATNAIIAGFCGYVFYQSPGSDYNSENAGIIIALGAAMAFSSYGIINGINDVIRGTNNYIGLKIRQKFSKDNETRERVESELEKQLGWN
jgi:hypothetical protein